MTIDRLLNNARALNLASIVQDSVEAQKGKLIQLQRLQMLTGYKSDGKRIGKYRNDRYAVEKAIENPLAGLGWVDLKLEGYFQADVFVEVRESQELIFGSVNEKTPKLVEKYGDDIFGLKQDNRADFANNYLKPEATTRIINQILK
jgi:hypothetical protein